MAPRSSLAPEPAPPTGQGRASNFFLHLRLPSILSPARNPDPDERPRRSSFFPSLNWVKDVSGGSTASTNSGTENTWRRLLGSYRMSMRSYRNSIFPQKITEEKGIELEESSNNDPVEFLNNQEQGETPKTDSPPQLPGMVSTSSSNDNLPKGLPNKKSLLPRLPFGSKPSTSLQEPILGTTTTRNIDRTR